ncbi:MAG: hypothetical protein R6U20_05025 [Longimonas sp.]|uniref:hypothetical protein n=1 Tax=Longimonas sp. TaxID=2039626 RepID=UPI003976E0F9
MAARTSGRQGGYVRAARRAQKAAISSDGDSLHAAPEIPQFFAAFTQFDHEVRKHLGARSAMFMAVPRAPYSGASVRLRCAADESPGL